MCRPPQSFTAVGVCADADSKCSQCCNWHRFQGKVKSIYENMKNLMDPTPRFDSHISKNSSKVTSLNSYRAFELTQVPFKLDPPLPLSLSLSKKAKYKYLFKSHLGLH